MKNLHTKVIGLTSANINTLFYVIAIEIVIDVEQKLKICKHYFEHTIQDKSRKTVIYPKYRNLQSNVKKNVVSNICTEDGKKNATCNPLLVNSLNIVEQEQIHIQIEVLMSYI